MIAPQVSHQCLIEALQLELNYLKVDLASNAGDRSDKAFVHNAYAVLTAISAIGLNSAAPSAQTFATYASSDFHASELVS